MHTLCGCRSGIFGSFCPGTVTQQVEDGLVIVRAEATGTYAWKPQQRFGWTAVGQFGGRYELFSEEAGAKTWKGPGTLVLESHPQEGGWVFTLHTPNAEYSYGYIGEWPSSIVIGATTFTYDEST